MTVQSRFSWWLQVPLDMIHTKTCCTCTFYSSVQLKTFTKTWGMWIGSFSAPKQKAKSTEAQFFHWFPVVQLVNGEVGNYKLNLNFELFACANIMVTQINRFCIICIFLSAKMLRCFELFNNVSVTLSTELCFRQILLNALHHNNLTGNHLWSIYWFKLEQIQYLLIEMVQDLSEQNLQSELWGAVTGIITLKKHFAMVHKKFIKRGKKEKFKLTFL